MTPPNDPRESRRRLEISDDFTGPSLDPDRWIDHYLPHWTTPDRSAARYSLGPDGLTLRIDADQPAWRLEDGPMRVSHLQTGAYSGPVGSPLGQHRHRLDLRVRTAWPTRRLWTPTPPARVEVTAAANPDPACMLGIWLVGFEEDSLDHSGEICVAELFGHAIGSSRSTVRLGVKAHHDPLLVDDVDDVALPIDAGTPHTYAAAWDHHEVRFFVDDVLVRTVTQPLRYPLQLMIDLFEFPGPGTPRRPDRYPKTALVRSVRGYRLGAAGA